MDQKVLNHSVSKAFKLLDFFSQTKPEWGVRELATEIGANKSTVYRLMATLEQLEVLRKDPVTEKYSLGLKLFELGNRVQIQQAFVSNTHPVLIEVAGAIAETVHLGILKGEQVLMVDKVDSPKGLKLNSLIGGYSPSYCTGIGKTLLAHLESDPREAILSDIVLTAKTAFTITDRTNLEEELNQIQQQGYAIDRQELEIGLICVAVPVYNQNNCVIAALSAAGPADRFREEAIGEYVEMLKAGANRIQTKIGKFQPEYYPYARTS